MASGGHRAETAGLDIEEAPSDAERSCVQCGGVCGLLGLTLDARLCCRPWVPSAEVYGRARCQFLTVIFKFFLCAGLVAVAWYFSALALVVAALYGIQSSICDAMYLRQAQRGLQGRRAVSHTLAVMVYASILLRMAGSVAGLGSYVMFLGLMDGHATEANAEMVVNLIFGCAGGLGLGFLLSAGCLSVLAELAKPENDRITARLVPEAHYRADADDRTV